MEKNKDLELKLNIITGVAYQVFIVVINLISKNLIQKKLGVEFMGLQAVFSNICDLIMLAFSGMGVGILYSLYRPIEERNLLQVRKVYTYYSKIYRSFAGISLIAGIVLTVALPVIVDETVFNERVIFAYFLYLISMLIYNRYILLHYVLIAFHKRYMVCLISGVFETIALILEIIVVNATGRYENFLWCLFWKNAVISFVLYFYLKKKHSEIFAKQECEELDEGEKKEIRVNIKDLLSCKAGSILIHNTDSILISSIINTVTTGCYSNYYFVSSGVLGLIGSFFESIISKIGSLAVTKTKDEFFKNFWKVSLITVWLTGFSVSCYYLLIQDFVKLWIGEVSILSSEIVMIVTLNLYMESMKQVGGVYRKSVGLFHKFDRVVMIRGILNIVLSIVLGKIWGLFGILAATAISNLITVYWYVPYRLYEYFGKSLFYEVGYQLMGLVSVLLTIGITKGITGFINSTTWGGFFVKAIFCAVISNVCYLLFALLYKKLEKGLLEWKR